MSPPIGAGENQWKTGGRGLFGNDTSTVYTNAFGTFGNGFRTPLDRNGGRITFYFITKFTWPYDPTGVILRGTNYLDDGAIVYLNGVEVFRQRIGTAGTEQAWGDTSVNQANEGVPEPLEYSAISLVTGENVLAVELHQTSSTSSDVAFATALRAVIPFAPVIFDTSAPADRAVIQNRSTTLSVRGDGSPRPTYQWYHDGSPIGGATSNSYTIASMQSADAGIYKVVLANEFGVATSRDANVTYIEDTVKPKIAHVSGSAGNLNVVVEFDEAMNPTTSTESFNYYVTIDGADIFPSPLTLSPDGKVVTLTFDTPFADDTVFTLHASGPSDLAGLTMDDAAVQFRTWSSSACGGVLFETFDTEGGSLTAIGALTGHPNFPNKPRESYRLSSFSTREVYTGDDHENYGGRMRALFIPPSSGNWVFYISSDDAGQLFLNPNGPGANGKILVQEEAGCCNIYSTHATAAYPMVAGQAYYLEALYKEGGGGDYCHVWAGLEGAAPPTTAAASLTPAETIPASMLGGLGTPANVAGTFSITQQPASQNVAPLTTVSFTVGTSTDVPLCYQWMRNGIDIPGAISPVYNLSTVAGDTGSRFSARLSILGGGTVTSAEALLTVAPDTTKPTVVSVVANIAGDSVVVTYSEAMGASAANVASYSLNGAQPASATATSGSVITLVPAAPLQDCVANRLVITGASDTSANVLNPNPTTVTFTKPQILVGNTDTQIWRYENTGADLGTAWRAPSFNDSGWASGAGPLVFPADEAMPAGWTTRTVLVNWVAASNTMYFRTKFNFASAPATVTRLQLSRVVDDGAIFWINGKQLDILRCTADSTYTTLATAGPTEPQTVETIDVPATDLVYGENVLAVEVHQSSTTSSDIVFGAELSATISACVPPLTVTRAGSQVVLTWPDASFRLEKASDVTGPWTSQAGASGVSLPATPGNAFFRLVKP